MITKNVLTFDQMEALTDPLRSQLMFGLRAYGKGSVLDLAIRLNRDAKSLYYPLRALIAVGLVEAVGTQKGRRKSEVVYALTCERFELPADASLELRQKLVKTTIRIAERDFLAAQEGGAGSDDLNIVHSQLWLESEAEAAFLSRLSDLAHEFSALSIVGKGKLLMWTSLVSPSKSSRT